MNIKLKDIKIMAEGVDTVDWSTSRTSFCLRYSCESFVEAVAYLACSSGSMDAL